MVEKIANWLTRKPKLVAFIAVLLLIPSAIGYISTRINYDILSYLPEDLPSSQGEKLLEDPFKMAATSMLVVEDMPAGYTNSLINEIKEIPGVSNAIWISNLMGVQIPTDMIPANFRDMFFSGDATMMIIQYDHPGASDETMEAIEQVRKACNEKCFLAGFSVVIKDTRDLMDSELPMFVGLAVLMALCAMLLTLESTVLPFIFLASIGLAVIYNMGTNIFLGEISYITKAIAAVLQLGVTMDYSIFLYHRYEEERPNYEDERDAMAQAVVAAFRSLSATAKDLAARAKENKLTADEYKGSTITVSNLGMFGIETFTPIINQPDSVIVGVCAIEDELQMDDEGKLSKHQVMRLSVTLDHRTLDGAVVAKFEMDLRDILQNPMSIVL